MTDSNLGDHEALDAPKNPWLTDSQYKKLEYLARVVLPGLAVLIGALGAVWGWDQSTKVAATIVALDAFLGVFLGFAQKSYDNSDAKYDGSIDIIPTESGGKMFSLNLEGHPDDLVNTDKVTFKINAPSA